MPLVLDITTSEQTRVGVWRIEENDVFFSDTINLSAAEKTVLNNLRDRNKLEWLASRFLLDRLLDHDTRIETGMLPSGKPYLIGRGEEISLSHSDSYVAAMVGTTDVGVDIQKCKDKILRVEHKFANAIESACIDRSQATLHLHVLWGAKEVMYKIYAKKQLSFISHIFVDVPPQVGEKGRFTGFVRTGDVRIDCIMDYLIIDNYVLVYGHKSI